MTFVKIFPFLEVSKFSAFTNQKKYIFKSNWHLYFQPGIYQYQIQSTNALDGVISITSKSNSIMSSPFHGECWLETIEKESDASNSSTMNSVKVVARLQQGNNPIIGANVQ